MKTTIKRTNVLITGGAGFLGTHLVDYLYSLGMYNCTVFDKLENHAMPQSTAKARYCKGNILSTSDLEKVFSQFGPFDTVFHLASSMPNKEVSDTVLWDTNIQGTRNIATIASKNKVRTIVFTSSNVTYGVPKNLPVVEDKPVVPLEIYGKSKEEAEKVLAQFAKKMNIQIFRCPVISGVGRLGLQAILFDFISDNKNVYLLGDGSNKYQFVDADDVCVALERARYEKGFEIYNIGADQIKTLKEIYQALIAYAKSSSKIICLPNKPALFALSILDKLNISPLGVYQYSMIGKSLYMNTSKIKRKLGWKPKKTNLDTFIDNYKWYQQNKGKFTTIGSGSYSANRSLPKMGILKLLKMVS